jgi:hypothetical protein
MWFIDLREALKDIFRPHTPEWTLIDVRYRVSELFCSLVGEKSTGTSSVTTHRRDHLYPIFQRELASKTFTSTDVSAGYYFLYYFSTGQGVISKSTPRAAFSHAHLIHLNFELLLRVLRTCTHRL